MSNVDRSKTHVRLEVNAKGQVSRHASSRSERVPSNVSQYVLPFSRRVINVDTPWMIKAEMRSVTAAAENKFLYIVDRRWASGCSMHSYDHAIDFHSDANLHPNASSTDIHLTTTAIGCLGSNSTTTTTMILFSMVPSSTVTAYSMRPLLVLRSVDVPISVVLCLIEYIW